MTSIKSNPRFPLYIPSKGRWEARPTVRALEAMGVPYYVVVEEQEYASYCSVIEKNRVLVLDKSYQRNYDTFDSLGDKKGRGPGPARNFAWEHSMANGFEWHWVMDDNIMGFHRFNKNLLLKLGSGVGFRCMEDFVLRYKNIAMAGPQYYMFIVSKYGKYKPFVTNTRIYSCNLIRNDVPFRWRGRYNEDTDLSLRMLKAGWCTVQFNAFVQNKMTTQILGGGNTAEFYAAEGTSPKSKMLVAMHPDVTKLVHRFGRDHHHVDYGPFKKMKLILRDDVAIAEGVDEYGMRLKHVTK